MPCPYGFYTLTGVSPRNTPKITTSLGPWGLTTVPTPKRPSKPPVLSTIHKMLTNPYYKGSVRFRGASYDGIHEPLVAPEVWYRVQASSLTAHQTSGEKTQSHDHYLKGTLYCGQCGSRLTLTNAKSRRGIV